MNGIMRAVKRARIDGTHYVIHKIFN